MEMTSPDHRNPVAIFGEAWRVLPFNIKLMLVHLWRAEQEVAGAYPPVEQSQSFEPTAHRRIS